MQNYQPSVFARDDTLLGVCESLGQDFGFNPLYLRVTLGVLMIWFPVQVLAAYAIAGLIVALSRWVFPNARPHQRVDAGGAVGAHSVVERTALEGDNEVEADVLAVAA